MKKTTHRMLIRFCQAASMVSGTQGLLMAIPPQAEQYQPRLGLVS